MLDVSRAIYRPAPGAPHLAREQADCSAWSLDREQVVSFYRLSKPLAEGELHDYGWLPCSISGHLRARDRVLAFEINAAGTSTWRDGKDAQLMGCSQAACQPLVILMPDGSQD